MMLRKHALWLVIRMVSIIHFDLQFLKFFDDTLLSPYAQSNTTNYIIHKMVTKSRGLELK